MAISEPIKKGRLLLEKGVTMNFEKLLKVDEVSPWMTCGLILKTIHHYKEINLKSHINPEKQG